MMHRYDNEKKTPNRKEYTPIPDATENTKSTTKTDGATEKNHSLRYSPLTPKQLVTMKRVQKTWEHLNRSPWK